MSRLGNILLFIGLVFMVLWFIAMRALSGSLMPFVWVLLGVGAACIVGAVLKDIKFFVELMGQRTTKHGLNLGALIIIVLVLLVLVNFVAFKHVKKLDYTKEGLHSLSDQTKNLLKSLDSDLEVRAFFVGNQQDAAEQAKFKDLAELYTSVTPKVKLTYINPVKSPDKAKSYDVTAPGTISIEYKGRKAKFEDATEQSFSNAIIKITRDKNKIIYVITGHGERDIESNEPTQLQNFKKALNDSSYDVKPLSFAEKQKVPDDAALIVIAGPKQPYFDPELNAIKDYLYKGGKLLLAIDPGTKTNVGVLAQYVGIDFKNNYILDQLGQLAGGGAATAIGINYSPSNEITKSFRQSMTVFHIASQLKVLKDKPQTFTVEEIVKSSPSSFTKPELKEGEVRYVEGKDEKGPLSIVDTSTGKMKEEAGKGVPEEYQAVVVGDSDFISNQLLDAQLNHDLAMNMVSYLAKDKELISIRPKQSEGSQITMTQVQATVLYYALVICWPIAIFLTGGAFWLRRRAA